MKCLYCNGLCIKKGKYKHVQRYRCSSCDIYQQEHYRRKRHSKEFYEKLPVFLKEGMSISSMARIFAISKSTVIRKIQQVAATVSKPVISECGQEYEIDEMHTFIGSNLPRDYSYIIYAINKRTRQVINFRVGRRTKEDIAHAVKSVHELNPRKIYTDKLNVYPTLIGKALHNTDTYKINNIERMNLTIGLVLSA